MPQLRLVKILGIGLLSCAAFSNAAFAQVPRLIRYQGFLKDSQSVPLQGSYTLTFRLYTAVTGGAATWTEAQTSVPIDSGSFNVLLGSVIPLDAVDWSIPLWLSIQVNTDAELSPRQQITSVPLALRAAVAEGLATPVTTSNITDDNHALVPVGAIILWTGASCPAGYSRVSTLDGKFIVSGSSVNTSAGGNNNITPSGSVSVAPHSHTVPANQSVWGVAYGHGGGGYLITLAANENAARATNNASTSTETPSATFSGNSFDNRPAFATVLLCQRN